MAKLPFIKFFPRDWMGDDAARLCSLAARGLWIDMLCLMHSAPRRGYLQTATGSPLPLEQIARMAGCSTDEATRLLSELETAGVYDCTEHGLIYSRRMVREAGVSQVRSETGRRGAAVTNGFCRGKTAANGSAKPSAKDRPSESQSLRSTEEIPAADDPADIPDPLTPPRADLVRDVWNATPPLPRLERVDAGFRRNLARRWQDETFREKFRAVIAALAKSDFYLGRTPHKFVATLTWFVTDKGWEKSLLVLDGQEAYEDVRRQESALKPVRYMTIEERNAADMKMSPPKRLVLPGAHHV